MLWSFRSGGQPSGGALRGGSLAEAIRENWERLSVEEREMWWARAHAEGDSDGDANVGEK